MNEKLKYSGKVVVRSGMAGMLAVGLTVLFSAGCAPKGPPAEQFPTAESYDYDYIVGPGDSLDIFVWRNPELSQSAIVRPDGKITVPLVEDLVVTGKTTTQLARLIEQVLSQYIRDPLVTVMVGGFNGTSDTTIRVIGEATEPQRVPYVADMTTLDLMIAVGGITDFAAGNRAQLIRIVDGQPEQFTVRLEDLIDEADMSADVRLAPGDIVIIPEAWF